VSTTVSIIVVLTFDGALEPGSEATVAMSSLAPRGRGIHSGFALQAEPSAFTKSEQVS